MKRKILLSALMGSMLLPVSAQVYQKDATKEFVVTVGGQSPVLSRPAFILTDANYDVYYGGAIRSLASGNLQFAVLKYNAEGVLQWSYIRPGGLGGDNFAVSGAFDPDENLVVGGMVHNSTSGKSDAGLVVLDHNTGSELLSVSYNDSPGLNAGFASVCADVHGNYYGAGALEQSATGSDALLVSWDEHGNLRFAETENFFGKQNAVLRIEYDPDHDQVVIAGPAQEDLYSLRYFVSTWYPDGSAGGSYLSDNSAVAEIDHISDITLDNSGNIIVCGGVGSFSTGMQMKVVKLDPGLNVVFEQHYPSGHSINDFATAVRCDADGNVITGGFVTTPQGTRYTVVKYDSTGKLLNDVQLRGTEGRNDSLYRLAVKPDGGIICTGTGNNGSNNDIYTICLDAQLQPVWEQRYNGHDNLNERPTDLAIDPHNPENIYIAGQMEQVGSELQNILIKYTERDMIVPPGEVPVPASFCFIENRGQYLDAEDNPRPDLKYVYRAGNPQVYFSDTALSYVFSQPLSDGEDITVYKRLDMKFAGAIQSRVYPMNEKESYSNYFFAHVPEGLVNVPNYERLGSFEVYPNTDIQYSGDKNGVKQEFIFKPGSDPSELKFVFTGSEMISTGPEGELIVRTGYGHLVFKRPRAFQLDAVGNRTDLREHSEYQINEGVVSLLMPEYDDSMVLVCELAMPGPKAGASGDPGNMRWGSYYGGEGQETLYDTHTDLDGNIYMTGASINALFPTSLGALQRHNSGDYDAFVVKFKPSRERHFATYYGGSNEDQARSITVDEFGDIYFCGMTKSASFPMCHTCAGYSDAFKGGDRDAFIVKLGPTGAVRKWTTFFGSSTWEEAEIIEYQAPYIYITGWVEKATDFPVKVQAGQYNQSTHGNMFGGSGWDIFLAKFHRNGTQEYTSFIGGTGDEEITGMVVDDLKELAKTSENLSQAFEKFHALQAKWRETGKVPPAEAEDLWQNYRLYVDQFFNMVNLNKELRDLDMAKNMELKTALCERAEKLSEEPSIKKAMNEVRQLQDEWRDIGFISKEEGDVLWDRFKTALNAVFERQKAHSEDVKTQLAANLEAKQLLCGEMEKLLEFKGSTHKEWKQETIKVENLMDQWRKIGFVPKSDKGETWNRFKSLRKQFYHEREGFYNQLRGVHTENLKLKTALCEKAEALKDNTDWENTANELKRLQAEWKKTGPVAQKHSDKIWKRFRVACDHFFENKNKAREEKFSAFKENVEKRKAIILKLESLEVTEDKDAMINTIKNFQEEFENAGEVLPREKEELSRKFNNAIDKVLKGLKQKSGGDTPDLYRLKYENLMKSEEGKNKIRKDRKSIDDRIKRLQTEITQLETNLGFFSKSKNAEAMLADFQNKIDNSKKEIQKLKEELSRMPKV